MKVRLISHSTPDNVVGVDDAQELIAYCARVSNPSNQNNRETSEKLIKYLIKHKHWSPLEMVNACLEIETTRDIARYYDIARFHFKSSANDMLTLLRICLLKQGKHGCKTLTIVKTVCL